MKSAILRSLHSTKWRKFTQIAIGIAVLCSIAYYLRHEVDQVTWSSLSLSIPLLTFALFLYLLYLINNALGWYLLTKTFAIALTPSESHVTWSLSVLGKYVPGKALLWGIRILRYRELKPQVPLGTICAACLIEYGLTIVSASVFIAVMIIAQGAPSVLNGFTPAAIMLLILAPFTIHPRCIALVAVLLRIKMSKHLALTTGTWWRFLKILLLLSFGWFIAGTALFTVIAALDVPIGIESLPQVATTYVAAGLTGILFIVLPAGLGAREAAIVLLLSNVVPGPVAFAAAVVGRIVVTCAELMLAGISWLYLRLRKEDSALGGKDGIIARANELSQHPWTASVQGNLPNCPLGRVLPAGK